MAFLFLSTSAIQRESRRDKPRRMHLSSPPFLRALRGNSCPRKAHTLITSPRSIAALLTCTAKPRMYVSQELQYVRSGSFEFNTTKKSGAIIMKKAGRRARGAAGEGNGGEWERGRAEKVGVCLRWHRRRGEWQRAGAGRGGRPCTSLHRGLLYRVQLSALSAQQTDFLTCIRSAKTLCCSTKSRRNTAGRSFNNTSINR